LGLTYGKSNLVERRAPKAGSDEDKEERIASEADSSSSVLILNDAGSAGGICSASVKRLHNSAVCNEK
jgi:hypothetical protein